MLLLGLISALVQWLHFFPQFLIGFFLDPVLFHFCNFLKIPCVCNGYFISKYLFGNICYSSFSKIQFLFQLFMVYFVFITLDFLMCFRSLFCDLLLSGQFCRCCAHVFPPAYSPPWFVHVLSSGVAFHSSWCWEMFQPSHFLTFSSWRSHSLSASLDWSSCHPTASLALLLSPETCQSAVVAPGHLLSFISFLLHRNGLSWLHWCILFSVYAFYALFTRAG